MVHATGSAVQYVTGGVLMVNQDAAGLPYFSAQYMPGGPNKDRAHSALFTRLVLESGLPRLSITSTAGLTDAVGSLHVGPCTAEPVPAAEDTTMFEALRADGVDFPAGSGPGYCPRPPS
jgi:hypothetical protein